MMAGTLTGGLKAAKTNKENHGENFYKIIGAKGGKKTGIKGFATNRELAREAGRKGGLVTGDRYVTRRGK